jgi:hypothetical protein
VWRKARVGEVGKVLCKAFHGSRRLKKNVEPRLADDVDVLITIFGDLRQFSEIFGEKFGAFF